MIGPSLDDDWAWLQARLALLQYQGRIALQQTNDVQRLGLVHRGMAGLVDHVVCPAEFGETFQRRFIEDRFGNSLRKRAYDEPTHLDIALGRPQYRLSG